MREYRFAASLGLALLMLLATASAASAQGQSPRTLTIDRPGTHTLNRDIVVANGDAIVITASGVTLDLNGHRVATRAGQTGTGILVQGATGVRITNGRVGGFAVNVAVESSVNVVIDGVQVAGAGAAPGPDGPSEIGIMLVDTRGAVIRDNVITSVNLGIFVRGGGSAGNRVAANTVVGGPTPAHNLLGICYNPAPGAGEASDPSVPGPRGDLVYANNVSRYDFGIGISAGSTGNVFKENVLAVFSGGFRETEPIGPGGGNLAIDNVETTIPAEVLAGRIGQF